MKHNFFQYDDSMDQFMFNALSFCFTYEDIDAVIIQF